MQPRITCTHWVHKLQTNMYIIPTYNSPHIPSRYIRAPKVNPSATKNPQSCTTYVHFPPNSFQRKETSAAASKCSVSRSLSRILILCSIPCRRKSLVCVFPIFPHFYYVILSWFFLSSWMYVEGCNCCCVTAWNHIFGVNLGEEFTLRFLNWRQHLVALFFLHDVRHLFREMRSNVEG